MFASPKLRSSRALLLATGGLILTTVSACGSTTNTIDEDSGVGPGTDTGIMLTIDTGTRVDSGPAPGRCGDGACVAPETASSCPADCSAGIVCGDGTCEGTENSTNCAADCPLPDTCGDGTCDPRTENARMVSSAAHHDGHHPSRRANPRVGPPVIAPGTAELTSARWASGGDAPSSAGADRG